MIGNHRFLPLALLVFLSLLLIACPQSVHERIEEETRMPLSDLTQARDRSLDVSVQENIRSDLELRWYATTYGLTVEVAHAVATVHMTVQTEEERDRALDLALNTGGINEVVDNIVVDPSIDGPPFEF